jgi:hypothetical protein
MDNLLKSIIKKKDEAHLGAMFCVLGATPSAIEARLGLTSYLCTLWKGEPNLNAYNQLVGAMMAIPAEGQYFRQATELSFLTGLYRMRLHLETSNGYYSK